MPVPEPGERRHPPDAARGVMGNRGTLEGFECWVLACLTIPRSLPSLLSWQDCLDPGGSRFYPGSHLSEPPQA
jgi:hypothetical protein